MVELIPQVKRFSCCPPAEHIFWPL